MSVTILGFENFCSVTLVQILSVLIPVNVELVSMVMVSNVKM